MKQSSISLIAGCRREFAAINKRIRKSPLDQTVQYLTMYSLIKSCGTVEFIFKSIIADYFRNIPAVQIQNYLDLTVRDASTSPKYGNICNLLNKFDDQWNTNFKAAINSHADKNRLINSIDSLVTNRHEFAHGKNPNVSFASIKSYFEDSVIVLKILDQCVR